jgi:hypothetical protein
VEVSVPVSVSEKRNDGGKRVRRDALRSLEI